MPPLPPPPALEQRADPAGKLNRLVDDVRSLPFSTLFPLHEWLKDQPWNLLWVRWFAFFALYPLALRVLWGNGVELERTAWAFGLYFALIWGLLLNLCLRPGKVGAQRVAIVGGFTAFLGINLLLLVQKLPVISELYRATESASFLGQMIGYVLGVGILEEGVKALPLYWLFIHLRKPTTVREASYLGTVSGLAFGVAEAVWYSILYVVWRQQGWLGDADYVAVQLLRFITLPLLHALWAGILGYFIGLAANFRHRAHALVIVGWAAVAMLHGLYDALPPLPGLGVTLVTFLLFIGYSRSAEKMVERMQVAV
ncbi:MAG: PrsW family intramembrane metalloprotease [Thermoanaerobaculia bacterium]|nr:PrsW family intramembrane metalloprotease [Thermoanaerobaculia bacterium]